MNPSLIIDLSSLETDAEAVIREYYAKKRLVVDDRCSSSADRLNEMIDSSLEAKLPLSEGDEIFWEHTFTPLFEAIDWSAFRDRWGPEPTFEGEDLDELIRFLENKETELEEFDPDHKDDPFPSPCLLQVGPLHLCRFAKERGYAVELLR